MTLIHNSHKASDETYFVIIIASTVYVSICRAVLPVVNDLTVGQARVFVEHFGRLL